MVHRWILYIFFFSWQFGLSQSGYNLPHLKHLNRTEIDILVDELPKGLNYRIYGGEESKGYAYPRDIAFISDVIYFLQKVEGTATIVFPVTYEALGTINAMKEVESSGVLVKWVEYGNELYFNPRPRNFRDWIDLIFQPRKFYRRTAHHHMSESLTFLDDMNNNGLDVWDRLVFNIPLDVMDNRDFKAYTEVVGSYNHIGVVDVHIYGKVRESDFIQKLYRNMEWITSFDWEVVCFEMNGMWHYGAKRLDLHLKNSDQHRNMHQSIIQALDYFGVDEVLYFTLCGNTDTQSWDNYPYFHKYLVTNTVSNEIENVWE